MSGLIVLVPYSSGQEFYPEIDEYEWNDEAVEENEDEEEQGYSIAESGSEMIEQDEYKQEEDLSNLDQVSDEACLPVYVQTEDEDLALMAVAHAACAKYRYVAFPADWRAEQEWQERNYPGTLKFPGVKLPPTEEAFEIPEPGDCFCCASLEDYEIYSLENFRELLEISQTGYLMSSIMEDDKELWQQFDDWGVRVLNYQLLNKKSDNSVKNLGTLDDDEIGWLD